MRAVLIAFVLLLATPVLRAQNVPDTLRAPAPAVAVDPFAGRLVFAATARAQPAGTGHVSLRSVGVVIIPVLGAAQGSVGVGRGFTLGGAAMLNIGGEQSLLGSGKATVWRRDGLHLAAGAHVLHRRPERPDGRGYTNAFGYAAATFDGPTGSVTVNVAQALRRPGRRPRGYPAPPLRLAAGAELNVGARTKLLAEVTTSNAVSDADGFGDDGRHALVIVALRTYGARSGFEIGVATVPAELDACRDSEVYFCVPPVFPHLSFTRTFRRR